MTKFLVQIHIPYETGEEMEFDSLEEAKNYILQEAVPPTDTRRGFRPTYNQVRLYEIAREIDVSDLMRTADCA